MLTHKEAQVLVSARQDEPLDPYVERELQAHLATCDECRAFAIATERLTAGMKAMPSIPVNPRTRREVMERVNRGRNPLAALLGGFGGGFQIGPVLAAVATILIVGLFGLMALDRLVFEDNGSENNQLAAIPTEQAVGVFVASPTDVPATETPEPTATDVPEEPTVTTEPEPTATDEPEPTATNEPDPTVTSEPDVTNLSQSSVQEDGDPTDLTTDVEPTATEAPPVPTATTVPTVTPAPSPTVVPTATDEPVPTNTPAIEPMSGSSTVDGTGAADSPEGIGSAGDEEAPAIESTGSDAGESVQDGVGAAGEIEPMGGDSEGDPTSENADDGDPDQSEPGGESLAEASVRYTGIGGDPSGHLGLTREGRLEFMQVPDEASSTTWDGFRIDSADVQPAVIHLCGDGYCEPAMEAPESESWQGDVPLGVIGDTTYFMRLYSDRTEVIAAVSSGTQLIEPQVLLETGATSAPSEVYENDGIMFAWLPNGQWLEISGGSAQLFSGEYANPYNLRFAPLASNGPLIGYFSNGTLIIAPVTAPDSPVLSLPTDSIDFDMSALGDRVVVIRGNDIVIYEMQGSILQVFEGGDLQPGSVIWLSSGIVYVDQSTGALYQIPSTAP